MSRILLLADDSLAIQRVVGLTFEQSDFEVVSTANGDDALLELARTEPAIVVADVHMPGASGYEVAAAVKERSPDTPVLLLVGTFEAFDEERCRASGADGHLLKPFDSQELLSRVDDLAPPIDPATPVDPATPNDPASTHDGATAEPDGGGDDEAPDRGGDSPAPPEAADAAERSEAPEGSGSPAPAAELALAPGEVERIARRVVEMLSEDAVREIAREVVPRVAEDVVRKRIEELERDVD